jgi:ribosomal protein S18 acetylase RimI-like enzyme
MEFRGAEPRDLPELMALFRAATQQMDARGILQWDEIYPDEATIRADIVRGQMRVGTRSGKIAVAFMLELCSEGDYEPADWRYREPDFAVLHRLCVHPDFQGQGVAKEAMDFLEGAMLSSGIRTIRLDAFSQNPAALHLYESRGYEKAGEIRYRKGLFYLYEKRL